MSILEKKCRALVRKWRRSSRFYDDYQSWRVAARELESILPRRKPKKGKRK